jgi:hypothetical protein
MAKDAGGHGSEGRGGSGDRPVQGAKFQARQSMKAANSPDSWEARYGTPMDRTRLRADAINQGVDAGFKSSVKAAGMTGDRAAAATLAGGHPKATPSPTHPAMSGPQPNDISQNAWKSRPSMTSSGKRFNPNTGTGKFERFK